MRWLFVFLLALNAAYLSWHHFHAERDRHAGAVAPRNVDTIVLLSELELDPGKDVTDETGGNRESEPAAASALPALAPVEEKVQDSDADAAALDPAAADSEASAAGQEGAAAQPPATAAAASENVTLEGDAAAQAQTRVRYRCFTMGPFRAMEDLRAVTRDIKDYVTEASFRSRDEKEATRFRVYLTQTDGLEGANRITAQLREQGIRDSFIIASGPLRHNVSLGYFSEKKRAHRHADTIREKGFDPVVEPVFKTYTLYWLDYRIREGAEIPPEIFRDRLDRDIGRLSRSCA